MKRFKKLSVVCVALLCMAFFTGCVNTQLAEGYDKDEILDKCETVIDEAIVNGLSSAMDKYMREDYRKDYPAGEMNETLVSLINGKGNFMAYSQKSVIGKPSPDTGEDFAVALITATYEKGEIIYTITLDKDLKVVGFYCK